MLSCHLTLIHLFPIWLHQLHREPEIKFKQNLIKTNLVHRLDPMEITYVVSQARLRALYIKWVQLVQISNYS